MSDSDNDLPDLVESSDDETPADRKQRKQMGTVEHADCWLKRADHFLEKQEIWNRVFCLCPFLYGVNNVLPAAWIKALMIAELLLNNERQYSLTFIPWKEWECIDLMDLIISIVQKKMRNRDVLSCSLDMVRSLDDCKTGVIIDVDLAIKEAGKFTEISDIWREVLKDDLSQGKEKAAKFGVLYCIRLYLQHVLSITEGRCDFVDETRNILRPKGAAKQAEEFKKEGNAVYAEGNYYQSVKLYTQAAEKDRLNHIYFGNRAQAYNKLKLYTEALADGRRAVTIKPDFSKGHYRYSQAFYYLGQLEVAIRVNKAGLTLCQKSMSTDYSNVKDLEQQGKSFTHENDENKLKNHLTAIPKDLAEKLNKLPSSNSSEDLSEKWGYKVEKMEKPRHLSSCDDDVPDMVSSDSESDSPPVKQKDRDGRPNYFLNKTITRKEDKTFDQHIADMFKSSQKSPKEPLSEPDVTSPNANNCTNANSPGDNVNNNARRRPKGAPEGAIPTLSTAPAPPLSAGAQQEAREAKKLQDKHDLQSYMSEGSDALIKDVSKTAMTSYHKALDIVSHSDMASIGLDEPDLVTLKYAFGIAAVMTGIFKSILEGIEAFQDIIETHQNIRFPLAYFGLGKAYITLNRYGDAVSPLNDGYTITRNVRLATVPWPGSKTIIPESHQNSLLECFQEAMEMCKFPPPPDAVCIYHSDDNEERTDIYLTDPDFKGVIKIICQMKCVIAFHQTCWRNYKFQHKKINDKDFLDTMCPTPDCAGLVIEINIMRPDSLTKVHRSEKHKVHKYVKPKIPLLKMKTTNEAKLSRRQEKKELRKQRRQEHRDEQDDLMDYITDMLDDSTDHTKLDHEIQPPGAEGVEKLQPLPDMKPSSTMLKKDDLKLPKVQQLRGRKLKKKRDKARHVINVPVNFADRQDETIGDSVPTNDEDKKLTTTIAPKKPLTLPQKLQPDVNKFEKTYNGQPQKHTVPMDDVTENLFSYFHDLLKTTGPITIDDPKIQQEMEVFPLEAQEKIKHVGGLGEFLRQSLKFAIIDDVISLLSEAVKARELALSRRNGRNLHGNGEIHDTWKTVGKGQNVDSLSLSITEISPKPSEYLSNNQKMDAFLHSRKLDGVGGGGNSAMVGRNKNIVNSNTNAESTAIPTVTPVNMSDRPSNTGTSVGLDTFDKFFSSANQIEMDSPSIDTLDSIDVFPALNRDAKNRAKHFDELDDFDEIVSDPGSEFFSDLKVPAGTIKIRPDLRPKPLYDPTVLKSETSVSRSSSHSDVSERSSVSSEMAPRPLKPLKGFGVGLHTQLWDKCGGDDPWAQVKREDFEGSEQGTDSPRSDLGMDSARKAAEEFVHKTDAKFVSELANSVVEKIYAGRTVPEAERLETLKSVSTDIWKDFERSAASGMLGAARFLDNNSGGVDYNKTVGSFASEFMKRHYLNEDGMHFPSTSNVNVVYPQTSPSSNPVFSQPSPSAVNGVFSQDTAVNGSSAWPNNTPADAGTNFNTNTSNFYQGPGMTPGYNLFSGPSYGFDSFGGTILPNTQAPPPLVRPPLAAKSFCNGAMPPNSTPSPTGLSFNTPLVRMPFSPSSLVPVDKFDKETQVIPEYSTVETMTEPYEPHKEDLLRMQLERDGYMQIHNEGKAYCEKLTQEYAEKENQYKHREVELSSQYCSLEQEKRDWASEREALQGEIRQLKHHLTTRDATEKELKDMIVAQRLNVNEIAKLATEQRDKDLSEIKKFMAAAEQYRHERDENLRRALSAEVEILKTKESSAVHRLERSMKEATYHLQHLAGFIKKHGDDKKSVPSALQQMSDHWKQVSDNCAAALSELKAVYENQRTEISNGKLLSDLTPVPVPTPPPMPDAIKKIMGNAAMSKMLPRQPSPYAAHANTGAVSPTLPHPASSPTAIQMMCPAIAPAPTGNSTGDFPSPTDEPPSTVVTSTSTSSNTAPPKPLSRPTGATWSVPRRPLTQPKAAFMGMGQQPVVMPARIHLPAGHKQPMTSFEKLMLKLQSLFPNYENSDFKKYIQELRQSRGGSLSGMTIEDITNQITDIIHARQKQQATAAAAAAQAASVQSSKKQIAAPPGLGTSWAFDTPDQMHPPALGAKAGADYFQEEEDPCVICHEEMASAATTTLECGHKFHNECIRKWFKEQSTCPNCRVHALLSDDFPTLG